MSPIGSSFQTDLKTRGSMVPIFWLRTKAFDPKAFTFILVRGAFSPLKSLLSVGKIGIEHVSIFFHKRLSNIFIGIKLTHVSTNSDILHVSIIQSKTLK